MLKFHIRCFIMIRKFFAQILIRSFLVLAVLFALTFQAAAICTTQKYKAPLRFRVGENLFRHITADFDLDGDVDVAVVDQYSRAVSVMLGDGEKSLGSPMVFQTGLGPVDIATGNFNNDPFTDLAVANAGDSTVSIFQGLGNGMFSAQMPFPVGSSPQDIAVADFDLDGNADLATANYLSDSVTLLKGNGAGSFTSAGEISAGTNPKAIVALKPDRDRFIDLAVVNEGSDNITLFKNRWGQFHSVGTLAVGDTPSAVASGDLNNDGNIDLAVTNEASDNVSVFFGSVFGLSELAVTLETGESPRSAAIGDLNNDGIGDLVVNNYDSDDTHIFYGGKSLSTTARFEAGLGDLGVTIADFNNDNWCDIVAVNNAGRTITVTLNDGAGNFSAVKNVVAEGGPRVVLSADVNEDGHADLISINNQPDDHRNAAPEHDDGGTITIQLGDGNGNFTEAPHFAAGTLPVGGAIEDFNNDSNLDIAVIDAPTYKLLIYYGNGDGTFAQHPVQIDVGDTPRGIAAFDLNSDSKPDIVTANKNSDNITILLTNTTGFAAPVHLPAGTDPLHVALGDVDHDGLYDIITANSSAGNISVLFNLTDGNFSAPVNFASGASPSHITAADINGDNNVDFVVTNGPTTHASLTVHLNDNNDGFLPPQQISLGKIPISTEIVDVNSDGMVDLAVLDQDLSGVHILYGNSTGTFSNATAYGVGLSPMSIISGEFNGDGFRDLVTSNFGSGNLSLMFNQCDQNISKVSPVRSVRKK